jgi:hypothetical protein
MNYKKLNFGKKTLDNVTYEFEKINVDSIFISTTFVSTAPITYNDLQILNSITGKDIFLENNATVNNTPNLLYNYNGELRFNQRLIQSYKAYSYLSYSGRFATTTGSSANVFKNLLKLYNGSININDNRMRLDNLTEIFNSDPSSINIDTTSGSGSNLYDSGKLELNNQVYYKISLDIHYSSPNIDTATSHNLFIRNSTGSNLKTFKMLQYYDEQAVHISWNTIYLPNNNDIYLIWNYPNGIQDYWVNAIQFSLLIEEYKNI